MLLQSKFVHFYNILCCLLVTVILATDPNVLRRYKDGTVYQHHLYSLKYIALGPWDLIQCLRNTVIASEFRLPAHRVQNLAVTIAPAPWEGNRNSSQTMQGWACKRPSAVWIIGYGLSQFVFCLFSLLLFRFSCCIYHATWALVSLKLSCSEQKTSLLSALSFWTRCHFQLQTTPFFPHPDLRPGRH